MILRCLAAAIVGLLLCAADDPAPPAQLESYIIDGRFDPGDYGWMKGRFDDATPEERDAFAQITRWSSECREAALAGLRADLAAHGVAEAKLDTMMAGPVLCRQVMSLPQLADYRSFAEFQQELVIADQVADTFLVATNYAEMSSRPRGEAELSRQLEARTVTEQMIRNALTLGMRPDGPSMTATGAAIFRARMGAAMAAHDQVNTEWLKGIVAERGWPKLSEVGPEASSAAWLLVQHADADPVFQLQALRLMEPLVAEGEVSKQNYAYLYDRVMLKLAGKQRYATQVMCDASGRRPLALEDEANVDRLRQEMGLGTVAEYLEGFERNTPCSALLAAGSR